MRNHPTPGADLIARGRTKNHRIMAAGVAGVFVLMFGLSILAGVLYHLDAKSPGGLFARAASTGPVVR